jgi:hypothetical protein
MGSAPKELERDMTKKTTITKGAKFSVGDTVSFGGKEDYVVTEVNPKNGELVKLRGYEHHGYYNATHMTLLHSAKGEFVLMGKSGDKYAPAETPRTYSTQAQAFRVAEKMALQHGGQFVVFKAVGEATAPKAAATVKVY